MFTKLRKAEEIFNKYGKTDYFIHDDSLFVLLNPSEVSEEDKKTLEELSFYISQGGTQFEHYKI